MEFTRNSKSLFATLFFRLLFGGYLVGIDQYLFNDLESAFSLLIIYVVLGVFATLFLFGKKFGLMGIIGLEFIFIILNSLFIILSLAQIIDVGLHDPLSNWWATLLRYLFSLLTLIFSFRIYREK